MRSVRNYLRFLATIQLLPALESGEETLVGGQAVLEGVMEISGTIAEEVRGLLEGWQEVKIKPDLQSIPRVAIAKKPKP